MTEPTNGPGFFRRTWDTGVEAFKRGWNGAMPENPPAAKVNVYSNGALIQEDLRARIVVPGNYITAATVGNVGKDELTNGIIFPYTPQIQLEYTASYSPANVTHSNYTQYFYNNSAVSAINISGKFTVQNDRDARVYIATKHLLAALTKMPYADDPGAGSPPPICRLFAYGSYMFKNVPVAISSFRIDLPAEVDYFMYGKSSPLGPTNAEVQETVAGGQSTGNLDVGPTPYAEATGSTDADRIGQNFVPVSSQITITCTPIYSRREMLQFSVKKYLEEHDKNTKYL
jgi:hypothetical protein